YKEDSEDEEFDVPVRRVKKYRGRSNRRKSQSSGPHPILRVTGIICGIVGFIFAVLYYIAAVVWLFLLLTMMSVRNLSPLFPMVAIGIVVFSIFIGFVTWRAAQLACGMNYEGVTQGWSEQSKIIAGIVVICVPSICMALLRYFNPEMSLISVG
ncbi:MAG: hypothetical protein JWM11_4503, partial [Planctomycetaceae bacterium]|nr:hypothetical protein [Planctomycetaceae bacterium]